MLLKRPSILRWAPPAAWLAAWEFGALGGGNLLSGLRFRIKLGILSIGSLRDPRFEDGPSIFGNLHEDNGKKLFSVPDQPRPFKM